MYNLAVLSEPPVVRSEEVDEVKVQVKGTAEEESSREEIGRGGGE